MEGDITPPSDGTPTVWSTTIDPSPDGGTLPGVVVVVYVPDVSALQAELAGIDLSDRPHLGLLSDVL